MTILDCRYLNPYSVFNKSDRSDLAFRKAPEDCEAILELKQRLKEDLLLKKMSPTHSRNKS